MTAFQLKIVTPDGLEYEGPAEEVVVRTTSGDMGVLAGHINCVAPLGMGRAMFVINGQKKYAACIGGMLSVNGGQVTLVPTTFEWAEEIDVARAERAAQKAQSVISTNAASNAELAMAEAKLKRALVRKAVATYKP
ncbi:MAG: ATP synthase F1 subunit epsilon [Oscillospiraceae bacterium]|nr:ATP synthase F1 subunit epsilon [Oscillospiraceae bacterium]